MTLENWIILAELLVLLILNIGIGFCIVYAALIVYHKRHPW